MCHLKRMFDGHIPFVIMEQIRDNRHRPFDNDCPKSIEQLVRKCTKKNPQNRPNIAAVIDEVDDVKCKLDVAKEVLRMESMKMTDTVKPPNKMTPKTTDQRQERCVVFGFGSCSTKLGFNELKMGAPIKLDHYGEVEFVDAYFQTSTIDRNGKMNINGVKETRIATRAEKVTGRCHSHYVIDAAGDLWSWGENGSGQLGHGDTECRETPKIIDAVKGVKEVCMGCADGVTVACITDDNTCYVWGDCGRFGLDAKVTSPIELYRKTKCIAIGSDYPDTTWVPQSRKGHALMIDTDDEVYAIGDNYKGELGLARLGDTRARSSWTRVTALTGRPIKVQCGLGCSAILTTTGVFTMGWDFCGATPKLTRLTTDVTDISMTWTHILALTTNGELYAWGDNSTGQCGVGSSKLRKYPTSNDQIKQPTRVSGVGAYHIRQISAGKCCSLLRCAPKLE